jgi:glucose-6-phosphate 1-epimerase
MVELFQGQPCRRIRIACGDTVLVAVQGAHVLSWVSGGRERLFLSPANRWDGSTSIRGGVPVCFPQFNARGSLPRHGFARNLPWQLASCSERGDQAQLDCTLAADEHTRAMWPQEFEAQLRVSITPGQLQVTLSVDNQGPSALSFSGALHTYLAVDAIAQARLTGLGGQAEWDALTDARASADAALRFDGEFDRVYAAAAAPLLLEDGAHRIEIAQSPQWADTVVWNPGQAKCVGMADMKPDGFSRMLCVEAAQVFHPIEVPAAGRWQGWQRLRVVA